MADVRLLELRNTYKWGGGPDKTILLSAERHDRARVQVVLAYIRDIRDREFTISRKAQAKGLSFFEIEERSKFDPRVLRNLKRIVADHDINIVHGHDYKSDLMAYLLRLGLRKRKIKLVATAHAWVMLGWKGSLYRRMDLSVMRRFDHLIAVSHATKEEMIAAGLPGSLISVVHNGIDTEVWSPNRVGRTLREELGIPETEPVIGYVGRIMPEKDLQTWIRAVATVATRFPQAHFVLVGEGKDDSTLEQLRRLAADLGIAAKTHFIGYRSELLPVYAAFDMFLLTSRREGLPNSILEAMALGLPVVTTDVAGARELVANGCTGYVLPQGDHAGLARALITLAENDQLRLRLSQSGRERVKRDFSFASRMARIESLYERILGVNHQT